MIWYTCRSKKEHATQVGDPWQNVVEFSSGSPIDNGVAQDTMAAWRSFERVLHLNFVRFTDMTLSSWLVEGDENPPDELYQYFGMASSGLRVPSGLAAPLTQTLAINKLSDRGQKGKLNFRGAVEQSDLQSTSEGYVMVPDAIEDYQAMVDTAWAQLAAALDGNGIALGMVSYPRIGWESVPVLPGQRPKTRPVYSDEIYERGVYSLRVRGTSHIQLKQH